MLCNSSQRIHQADRVGLAAKGRGHGVGAGQAGGGDPKSYVETLCCVKERHVLVAERRRKLGVKQEAEVNISWHIGQ